MSTKKFHDYFQNLYIMNPQGFQIVGIILLSLVTLLLFHWISGTSQLPHGAPEESIEASTFIPENHTLIPIKLINQNSLSPMIENFGWIDLYSVKKINSDHVKGKKIVKKIRILRAPLDPDQFGIIVPNDFVDPILEKGPKYFATLNKKQYYKSELVFNKKGSKRVHYGDMF